MGAVAPEAGLDAARSRFLRLALHAKRGAVAACRLQCWQPGGDVAPACPGVPLGPLALPGNVFPVSRVAICALLGYPLKAGHPLEGSRQEGKHPPYTPFCIFCRGMSYGISLPICRFTRTRVFSGCDVTRPLATHQTPIRIKAHDGHLALWPGIRPLAHLVPQKTLGTLPRPIVTSTVHVALPEGSTPKLARGRGVAKTRQVA